MKQKRTLLVIFFVLLAAGILALFLWKGEHSQSDSTPGTLLISGKPPEQVNVTVDGDHCVLPLLKTAGQLGVQILWTDADHAQLIYGSEIMTLSLSRKELLSAENGWNLLDPLPGCTYYSCSVEDSEVLVDGDTLCYALRELGLTMDLTVDRKSSTVSLEYREPAEPETTDSEPEYVIYNQGTMGERVGLGNANGKTGNVRFESAEALGLYGRNKDSFEDEQLSATRELTLGEKTRRLDYRSSYTTAAINCHNSAQQQRCIFDRYVDGDEVFVTFHRCTGEVSVFAETAKVRIQGDLTEQQAVTKSEELIKSLYGKEFFTEDICMEIQSSNDGINDLLCVTYCKTLCGYPTEDKVAVSWYLNGKLAAINAQSKGTFRGMEQSFTREQLELAEQTVLSAISESWSCGEGTLVFAGDGKCYLRMIATRESSDPMFGFEASEFYLAVDTVAGD